MNNATLPGQSAGKWSIRVFKDGGYKLQHRLDFEIQSSPQQPSTPTSSIEILEAVTGKPIRFNVNNDGRAEWNRDRADAWEYFQLSGKAVKSLSEVRTACMCRHSLMVACKSIAKLHHQVAGKSSPSNTNSFNQSWNEHNDRLYCRPFEVRSQRKRSGRNPTGVLVE